MLEKKLRTIFRRELFELTAYTVTDPGQCVKLDAMENPYAWPAAMVDDWLETLRTCEPNRYPDPNAGALKNILRACNGVPEGAGILLGNGSDELIQIVAMAVATDGATVLSPEPSFVMYRQIAKSLGLRYAGVPLKSDAFSLDMDALRLALHRHRPAVVFLAFPNNPTGNLFAESDILEILDLAPGLVVIDEAYAPFAEASFMNRLGDYPHLVVMRTVSKLGLAGLRLGFLAAAPEVVQQLEKIRLPYNINILTQLSAEFALKHYSVFDAQTRNIRDSRESLFDELDRMADIHPYPSRANFILFQTEAHDADEVFSALKTSGILIKNLSPAGGMLKNCLRVTVGKPDENRAFIEALRKIIHSLPAHRTPRPRS